MTPRKVSLRVAHSGACPNANSSALTSVGRGSGCKCQVSYYTFQRDRDGRPTKSARVKDRRTANEMLEKAQRELDAGRGGVRRRSFATLGEWVNDYEQIIEARIRAGELKPRTLDNYRFTLTKAKDAFGSTPLNEIGPPELRRFSDALGTIKPASRLRYLRELSACLGAAVDDGRIDANPVPVFIKKSKLRKPKAGKAPFEIDELPRLWSELAKVEPVYLYASQFASEAALRLREVTGLDWENVSLTDRRVQVDAQYQEKHGLVTPKGGTMRTLLLTREALDVLTEWAKVNGAPASGPVFPNESGGRLSAQVLEARFETAREDAGIPKLHPTMREPVTGEPLKRTFHSLKYTTSVLMQFRGHHPRAIEQSLGHKSLDLTYNVYGRWSPEMVLAEIERVEQSD